MPVDSFPKFNAARANSAQEDKEYIEEIDSGDEPLRGQDSQPTVRKRLGREDNTAQRLTAELERIAHRRRLGREDQTAQRLAGETERIAHRWRLGREDQTAQ